MKINLGIKILKKKFKYKNTRKKPKYRDIKKNLCIKIIEIKPKYRNIKKFKKY